MDAKERRAESVEDMTAALMAPIPNTDTQDGVRFCRASGSTFPASPRSNGGGRPYSVWFQSEKMNFNMFVSFIDQQRAAHCQNIISS